MENGVRIHVHPSFRKMMKKNAVDQNTFIYDLSKAMAEHEELFKESMDKLNPRRRL